LRRHGLDSVQGEEALVFARLDQHALGVVEALELAVVFVQVVVARREAAGREGERNFAEGEDFGLNGSRLAPVQDTDEFAGRFERRHPAHRALAGVEGQRRFVVNVEVRSADEGNPFVLGDLDGAQIVRLDCALGFLEQAAQGLEVALRFEKCLCREDDVLAGVAQVARQAEPVLRAQLLAARANDFAEVNAVDVGVLRHFGIELEDFGFRPEEKQGAKGNLHCHSLSLNARGGCRRPAWLACLPTPWRVRPSTAA
jgi:hypothetical protein